MHDDIPRIDQHPVAMGHALDAGDPPADFVDITVEMIGDGPDMALRTPRGDDHEVSQCRLALNVDGDNILGLRIVEALKDGFQNVVRRNLPA